MTMKFSIVIATYNRAEELGRTLDSLAALRVDAPWELIVVDNNSTDRTRETVEAARTAFPAPLVYMFEREQGRSAALNAGLALARGALVVTTDDDVRVEPHWLTRIARGFETQDCDSIGGPVFPLWRGSPPRWLSARGGPLWAVIALQDFGPAPIQFGERIPLGVNMAFRREAFAHAGAFNTRVGRKAGTLLGQEVREWCVRAHAAGLRGFYIPDVVVRHVIPAERLSKAYYRRWFFWRGVSRALLYAEAGLDMEKPEQSSIDFSRVSHLLGVPRYLFRTAVRQVRDWLVASWRRDPVAAFEHQAWLCFFAGILVQRWRDRWRTPPAPLAAHLRSMA